MVHEEPTKVSIELEKNMIFHSLNEYLKIQKLIIDETLDKKGKLDGPDAASLLGLAIISCLSASFIFCLNKRNLSIDDLTTSAEITFKKLDKGYTRVDKISVNLTPKSDDPDVLKRIKLCSRELNDGDLLFEKSCIITPSIREGIDVSVKVNI
ncbi:MAG: OsmC family protein [Candidatus Lokiarchaeota archaeon]